MADPRKEASGKPSEPSRKAPEAKAAASGPEPTNARRISITIDTQSGQILNVEAVDEVGARRELTAKEKTGLARESIKETVEDILEKAFAAGITSVLGDGDEDEAPETEEDTKLRHLIVRPMIAKSVARRFMKRETLSKAILGTLIQGNVAFKSPDSKPTATRARPSGPSTGSRRPTSRPGRAGH
jgi:hypothetical protein